MFLDCSVFMQYLVPNVACVSGLFILDSVFSMFNCIAHYFRFLYCVVFLFVCSSWPVLPLFLDCSFLIMPSVFSNASLPQPWCLSLVNLSLHYSMIHFLRHKSLAYLSTPTYQYKSNTKHYSSYYYQVLRQPIWKRPGTAL